MLDFNMLSKGPLKDCLVKLLTVDCKTTIGLQLHIHLFLHHFLVFITYNNKINPYLLSRVQPYFKC